MALPPEARIRNYPQEIHELHSMLEKRFAREAKVIDSTTGYIDAAFMNKPPLDPSALDAQARILAHELSFTNPDFIVGIPQSGLPLAKQMIDYFPRARFLDAKKTQTKPVEWPRAVLFQVYSFTQKAHMTMALEDVPEGSRILVVDDVSAHGHAGGGAIETINKYRGVAVGLAVGFYKQFQGGLHEIAKKYRVPTASAITVVSITKDNQFILQ
jgi:adenine/guanine phosphoribosyltransferase-like PRPP-binding protein